MDMRCCVVNWWQGLVFRVIIYDWFLMHNMDYGLHLLVFYSSLVMNHWLLSVNNLLLMDDWLLLDDSSRYLRVMEHALVNHRLLNNLLLNHTSWLNDIGWLHHMGFLYNVSWLCIMVGHFGDNRLLVHVRIFII